MIGALVLALNLVAPPTAVPEPGATCELGSSLTVTRHDRGKGRRVRIKKASALVLLKLGKNWSMVRVGDRDGFARSKQLMRRCVWASPPDRTGFDEGRVAMASIASFGIDDFQWLDGT